MGFGQRRRGLAGLAVACAIAATALSVRADAPRRTIVFGSDHDFPPFGFLDENGEPRGFTVELIRAVGEATGHNVEVRLGQWQQIRQQLEKDGTIDVVDMYESALRKDTLEFSNPIQVASNELFVRSGVPGACNLANLASRNVLVQARSFALEYLAKSHPTAVPVPAESEPEALRRLSAGEADCAIVSAAAGRYVIRTSGLDNLTVNGPPFSPRNHSFAVKKGRAALLSDLNRGLAIVKATGRYGKISERWLATPKPAQGTDYLRRSALILGPLVLLAGAALVWTWSLRRRVRERTRELGEELLERRRAVNALRESEQRFRTLVQHAPEAIFVIDTERRTVEQSNEKASRLLELPEGEHQLELDQLLANSESREAFDSAFERAFAGERVVFEQRLVAASGAEVPCEVRLVQLPSSDRKLVRVSLNDIRERKRREQRAMQGQRMEALGRLAGGIAHDFNNLLSVISAHGELLKMQHAKDPALLESVDEILEAGERAASLTRQLLAFGRQQITQPRVLSVNELIREVQKLLRRLLGEDVELVMELAEDAGQVRADPSQLEQVVVNLALNARDSMPEGGKLCLRTRRENRTRVESDGVPVGDWLVVEVEDTGSGIAPEIRSQIFEPFFTTKETAGGTGLGLATVYGIATASGGTVTVESEVSRGSTFRVWLPRTTEAAEPRPRATTVRPRTGSELVLLVEDEEPLRKAIARMLVGHGYEVVSAAEASEALMQHAQLERPPDALVTDVVMPTVSGRELAEKLRERQASLPVLFLTGHTDDVVLRRGELPPRSQLLNKPFGSDELLRALDRLLRSDGRAEKAQE